MLLRQCAQVMVINPRTHYLPTRVITSLDIDQRAMSFILTMLQIVLVLLSLAFFQAIIFSDWLLRIPTTAIVTNKESLKKEIYKHQKCCREGGYSVMSCCDMQIPHMLTKAVVQVQSSEVIFLLATSSFCFTPPQHWIIFLEYVQNGKGSGSEMVTPSLYALISYI